MGKAIFRLDLISRPVGESHLWIGGSGTCRRDPHVVGLYVLECGFMFWDLRGVVQHLRVSIAALIKYGTDAVFWASPLNVMAPSAGSTCALRPSGCTASPALYSRIRRVPKAFPHHRRSLTTSLPSHDYKGNEEINTTFRTWAQILFTLTNKMDGALAQTTTNPPNEHA
jgi:hypothetical protein